MKNVNQVFCVWEWTNTYPQHPVWKIIHSCAMDFAGNREPSNSEDWETFLQDGNDEPILGRLVTMWSYDEGVRLLAMWPPTLPQWLTPFLADYILDAKWPSILEGGHQLVQGTVKEALKFGAAIEEKIQTDQGWKWSNAR